LQTGNAFVESAHKAEERRGCLRLLLEAAEPIRILRNKSPQDLDGHFPLQRRVASAVHFAHSARTQEADNLIGIDFCARG
jgi:hypothetical protein